MDYNQTLEYLYNRLPMFSRIGAAAYKKDLTNTIALCNELDNPQRHFKTIHIAGTNGKGSVSHMLAAIFQQAGYKTGLYTSPHLKDFRERIKVNGEMMPKEKVVAFTEKVIPAIDKLEPSFFELTVAMAFDHFANEKVDIAIIETGLGGRLDSTNIITPEISVITNIGWDHMNLLGDTLEKIAGEKAGIIKEGIPVVIGETIPESIAVFEQTAAEKNSPIHFATNNYAVLSLAWEGSLLNVTLAPRNSSHAETYQLDLPGVYQVKNLLTVLTTCELLSAKGWQLEDQTVKYALRNSKKLSGLHGRWEIIYTEPLVVLDVAHNEDGVRQLLEQIQLTPHEKLHIVLGMVKDKDISNVIKLLPDTAAYYFTEAGIQRAMKADELAKAASITGLYGDTFTDVNEAICAALDNASKHDLIVVCGSIFLVGEVSVTAISNCCKKVQASETVTAFYS